VHDPGTALAGQLPHFVSTPRVAGVNPDSDDIAWVNGCSVDRVERFVDDDGVAPLGAGGGGQHIQPPRRDNRHAKRYVTRIQQMDSSTHSLAGLSGGRDAHILSARTADRVIEELKCDPLTDLKVPEFAQEICFVEKDIPTRS